MIVGVGVEASSSIGADVSVGVGKSEDGGFGAKEMPGAKDVGYERKEKGRSQRWKGGKARMTEGGERRYAP